MRIRAKKPEYIDIDGEYVVPVRFSEDLTHQMMTGWYPWGFGWVHLNAREDGSFDFFVRTDEVRPDLNLVKLSNVQVALMAALDLADTIVDDDESSPEATKAAKELKKYVSRAAS